MAKHKIYGNVPEGDYSDDTGSAYNPTPLPTKSEMDDIMTERPGDQVYQTVRHHVEKVREESKAIRDKLIEVILRDMYTDMALSSAVDDIGATAEYLAQETGADKATFKGDHLMADFARISKFKTTMEIGKLLNLSDTEMELVMHEEVARLWHDPKHGQRKEQPYTLSLPDEVLTVLKGLSKLGNAAKPKK